MIRWLQTLTDVLWPRRLNCLCCDDLTGGDFLCPACRKGYQSLKLSPWQTGDAQIRSVLRYDGEAKQLILLLKTRCVEDAAHVLAQDMAEVVDAWQLPQDTVLTWVTMPAVRRRVRGIDHGRILCGAVAERSGMPIRQLLQRHGHIHTQRGLGREARLRNLSGTILCNEKVDVPVLLIDDVLTTGATASACADALLKAGAPQVFVLTAARVMQSKKH